MRSVVDESFFCIAKSPTARSARSYRAWNSRAFHIRSCQQPSVHSCDEPQLPRGSNLLGALYHGAFMTHTAYTPRLSDNWEFQIDSAGQIVICQSTAAICQAVANDCRCFTNDLYFESERGIDWFTDQLGKPIQRRLREAAEAVPGVESVESIELEIDQDTRRLTGSINIITTDGDYGRAELR